MSKTPNQQAKDSINWARIYLDKAEAALAEGAYIEAAATAISLLAIASYNAQEAIEALADGMQSKDEET